MYSKEEILNEIKKIAHSLNQKFLTRSDFKKHSKISVSVVKYHFSSWNEAIKDAGLEALDPGHNLKRETIPDEELLSELIRLFKQTGKYPTESLINAKGKYSVRPYKKRWGKIGNAFSIAKQKFPDLFAKIEFEEKKTLKEISKVKILPENIKPTDFKRKKVIFGEPIDFRGLRFAPVNEQGVVYLFGMISNELGYLIESIRTDYPDCEGKRCYDKKRNLWEHIQIEFEYKSSNFLEHGHSPEQCNVIVCWEHDWPECPVDVLELKSTIKCL